MADSTWQDVVLTSASAETSTLQAAQQYLQRQWALLPIPYAEKAPRIHGWPEFVLTDEDLTSHFSGRANVGVILGSRSRGLVDVDLDCTEALALAERLLPKTASVFGRTSKPRAHYFYYCDHLPSPHKFAAPDGECLAELRSSGQQTIIPPSMHPAGEAITWARDGEPATVDAATLSRAVALIAAAALFVRNWPPQGQRHDARMALIGCLARSGWAEDLTIDFVQAVVSTAQSEDRDACGKVVGDTRAAFLRLKRKQTVTGIPRLAALLGENVVESASEWLGLNSQNTISFAQNPKAITRCFADIAPEPLRWLWPGRIPLGKLTLLIGDPGLGKSLITIDIAARITRGTAFPDEASGDEGGVLFLSAEDDPADTIRPRLDASAADVSRVHTLEAVCVYRADGSTGEKGFNLESDVAALENVLHLNADIRLIIIDPISAYLGGIDSHSNAEVRGLLAPLVTLAAKHEVAIMAVTHLPKSRHRAVHSAIGSIAFAAAARAVWAVAADPDDAERRLMLPAKQNLAANSGGLAFRIRASDGIPQLVWEKGVVSLDANEILCTIETREDRSALRDAKSWLNEQLANGPVSAKSIQRDASQAQLAPATIRRAALTLGVKRSKTGFNSGWQWSLTEAVQGEGAQQPMRSLDAFERDAENKSDNSQTCREDAQAKRMTILDEDEVPI